MNEAIDWVNNNFEDVNALSGACGFNDIRGRSIDCQIDVVVEMPKASGEAGRQWVTHIYNGIV